MQILVDEPREWLFDRQLQEQLEFLGKENGIITRQKQVRWGASARLEGGVSRLAAHKLQLGGMLPAVRQVASTFCTLPPSTKAILLPDVRCAQDHFIFKIEGTGALPCNHIVLTALSILMKKVQVLNEAVPV